MCRANEAIIIDTHYFPRHLQHRLLEVFKPKNHGYEHWNPYKADLTPKEAEEIYGYIREWAKEEELSRLLGQDEYIVLYFLYGWEHYRPQKLRSSIG